MALPTGTVTFLFTDVEGSTREWDTSTELMSRALDRHDAVLRKAIAERGGHIFATGGDGVSAAFPTVDAAVGAAVTAQGSLSEEDWADLPALRVRMGIHTGVAEERDGDYFGPVVNRCARLMSVGHGGQILCSQATTDLLGQGPPGTVLVDHGEHRLKDLSNPERITEVRMEGAGPFPALKSLDARPHNLPVLPSSFIGRDEEIAAVGKLLDAHRLVVLTGIGGSGKTRLALEVAARESQRYPDGVYFVDLAAITDPDQVTTTVAAALAITVSSQERARAQLIANLERRRMLIVLDNCEHLIDECADLVDELLTATHEPTVLGTSRESLRVEGEAVWPLAPLGGSGGDDDPAVRLFIERALAVRPDFVPDAANNSAINEICRHLDGLPLAIELAAARVAHMAPTEIANRLNDRFALLTAGRRRSRRQQTLQGAMEWSHDLLSEDEKALLRRLAVFSGSFALGAVEAVCALDPLRPTATVGTLGSLVDKSLVVAHVDRGRYRLLETVRLFALAQLEAAGETEVLQDSHCDWFTSWSASIPLERSLISSARIVEVTTEWPNLHSATSWALDHDDTQRAGRIVAGSAVVGAVTSRTAEGRDLAKRFLARESGAVEDRCAAYLFLASTSILLWTGEVRAEAEAGLALAGPSPLAGLLLSMRGFDGAALAIGPERVEQRDAALEDLRSGVRATKGQAPSLHQWALDLLAMQLQMHGMVDEAMATYDDAIALGRDHDMRLPADMAALGSSSIWHLRGEHTRALDGIGACLEDLRRRPRWEDDPAPSYLALFAEVVVAVLAGAGDSDRARSYVEFVRPMLDGFVATGVAALDCQRTLIAAVLAVNEREIDLAARLLAATGQFGRGTGLMARSPIGVHLYVAYRDRVREMLGPDRARRLRDEGRAMNRSEALALANEYLTRTTP